MPEKQTDMIYFMQLQKNLANVKELLDYAHKKIKKIETEVGKHGK